MTELAFLSELSFYRKFTGGCITVFVRVFKLSHGNLNTSSFWMLLYIKTFCVWFNIAKHMGPMGFMNPRQDERDWSKIPPSSRPLRTTLSGNGFNLRCREKWGSRERRKRKQTCYSGLSLLLMSWPGIVRQAGGTLCQWRRGTCWQSRQAERERLRERERTRVRRWKNKSWKANDGVRLNGQVVNALWDWAEEVVECSVSSITPHKSGGLLSLPAFALNYLSPVHTYSSSLMASSHSPSHATGHRGHLHTVYVLCARPHIPHTSWFRNSPDI